VDHKAGDYEPDVWNDERSETAKTTETQQRSDTTTER
jgi:hypothetical protein